jgi:arylsulfatase
MSSINTVRLGMLGAFAVTLVTSVPAAAQQQQKPNILFIMGDDIGWIKLIVKWLWLMT